MAKHGTVRCAERKFLGNLRERQKKSTDVGKEQHKFVYFRKINLTNRVENETINHLLLDTNHEIKMECCVGSVEIEVK